MLSQCCQKPQQTRHQPANNKHRIDDESKLWFHIRCLASMRANFEPQEVRVRLNELKNPLPIQCCCQSTWLNSSRALVIKSNQLDMKSNPSPRLTLNPNPLVRFRLLNMLLVSGDQFVAKPKIDPFEFSHNLEDGMRAVAVCAVISGQSPVDIR